MTISLTTRRLLPIPYCIATVRNCITTHGSTLGVRHTTHVERIRRRGAELLDSLTGGNLTLVTYKGIGAIVPDVVSGQVHLAIGALPAVLPLAKAGRLRPIAVTGATRDSLLPEVPTIAESGVPGYDVTTWVCIMTTGGTPRPIIDRLNAEIRRVMALPEVRETFEKQGTEPQTSTPDELTTLMRAEAVKWAGVLKNRNIKAQ
jgi:tripartite-type tricarboxylate transporter receptor subunit TctC